ncbi:hypothetical protein D3C73_857120 [compost metagenome]
MDPVLLHVGKCIRIEVVLAGDDLGAHRLVVGRVEVRADRPVAVVGAELQAVDVAAPIVEGGIDVGGAELAFVLQARDAAVVGIQAEGEVVADLL